MIKPYKQQLSLGGVEAEGARVQLLPQFEGEQCTG